MAASAGILMYRIRDGVPEILIVHPGGPFWSGKHQGAWSIPKGEVNPGEEPLVAARREFAEETGLTPEGPFVQLTPVRLRSGKTIHAWGVAGDCDPRALRSNSFEIEWPPRSGHVQSFPEVDEARFCGVDEARRLLNPAQVALVEELLAIVGATPRGR